MSSYRYNSFKFPAAALKGVDSDCVKGLRSYLASRESAINRIETSTVVYPDGPFAGQPIEIESSGTLTLDFKGWVGYYANGQWSGTIGQPVAIYESIEKSKASKEKASAKGFTMFESLICELAEPIEDKTKLCSISINRQFGYGRQDDFGNHINGRDGRTAIYQDDFGKEFTIYNSEGRFEICQSIVLRAVYTIGRTTFKVLPTEQGIDKLRTKLIKSRKWFADKYFKEPMLDLLGDSIDADDDKAAESVSQLVAQAVANIAIENAMAHDADQAADTATTPAMKMPQTIAEAEAAIHAHAMADEFRDYFAAEKSAHDRHEIIGQWRSQFVGSYFELIASNDIASKDYEKLWLLVDNGKLTFERACEMIDGAVSVGIVDGKTGEYIKKNIRPIPAPAVNTEVPTAQTIEPGAWTSERCEAALKAQQANDRPTIQSKSGAYCAWFFMLTSGAFGLRFAVPGQPDITAEYATWHDRMVAVQSMGKAIDYPPTDSPEAGQDGPTIADNEPVATTAPAVSSDALGASSAVSKDITWPKEYIMNVARYSKDKVSVTTPSADGFKTRAARLACTFGRWSRRDNGYIMSRGQASKFARLYADGWDASIMGSGASSREAPNTRLAISV